MPQEIDRETTRRLFLRNAGSVLGLAAATLPAIRALAEQLQSASRMTDADFWAFVQ